MRQAAAIAVRSVDHSEAGEVVVGEFVNPLSDEPNFMLVTKGVRLCFTASRQVHPELVFVTIIAEDFFPLLKGGLTARKAANCFCALSESFRVFRKRAALICSGIHICG